MLNGKTSVVKIVLTCFCMSIFLTACPNKKEEDKYYHLSDAQKQFINAIKTGDTVIWQSSLGYKDTAIIQPVVTETYLIKADKGNVYGERAYYKHKFIGNRKSSVSDGVVVFQGESTSIPPLILLSTLWDDKASFKFEGYILSKKIGGVVCQNVYWSPSNSDTAYISDKGYLGYKIGGEVLSKIK